MQRRELIRAMGAMTMASVATSSMAGDATAAPAGHKGSGKKWSPPAIPPIILGDSHFLSKTNPDATADQRELDALAIKVMAMPAVLKAREMAKRRYRMIVGKEAKAEALVRFNDAMWEEYCFRYVQVAVNSDANYPKVYGALHSAPHEWFDVKVPGGRSGEGDGPDASYSMVPLDHGARFELHGKRFKPFLADQSYTALADFGITSTTAFLNSLEMKVNADDTFVITIGPEPANGRANHIQMTPESKFLLIRNNKSDWRQSPNAYRVRRMDPPTGAPITVEQIASRAAWYIVYDVANNYMLTRIMTTIEPNTIVGPFKASTMGGLESQRAAMSQVRIADDEALVVTLSGNVPYRSITLFDYWFRTFDYWNRTSNLNNYQTADNSDGSATFVISIQDPGVHNWLDPAGYHEPVFWVRWQGRHWSPEETPWFKSQLVKLADLDSALPVGMKRVTPEERKQQLAQRYEDWKLRFVV